MQTIPRLSQFDSTTDFLKEGYTFISRRCEMLNSDAFQTRLMLKKVICLRGAEAAEQFYDTNLFKRQGAAPTRVQKTLFGQGGVQGLDGEAHRHRKRAFMELMTPASIRALVEEVAETWRRQAETWQTQNEQIEFFYEANEILCRATCAWAGVTLKEGEVEDRTRDFMSLINSAGALGPQHWRGRWVRRKMNSWAEGIIEAIRADSLATKEGTAAHVFAHHRDLDGERLDARIAAVELLNVIRPTVAVARYFVFTALALHENPVWREKTSSGEDADITQFVQEVRRFYPFFPVVAAITKTAFDWRGYHFPKGQLVMLDLYGTNHDTHSWHQPEAFQPERFSHWNANPFDFIAQGGSDHSQNHRCAGEWLTIELMKMATRFLTRSMTYQVPPQDLTVELTKMPALPKSGFIMNKINLRETRSSTRTSAPQEQNRSDAVPNRAQ